MVDTMMRRLKRASLGAMALVIAGTASAVPIIDRGLPNANLNNAAGGARSNVAWGFAGDYLAGDDFVLSGVPKAHAWQIDKVSVWVIGGDTTLGDRFSTVSLFLGPDGSSIDQVSSAGVTGNTTDNANVQVSLVNYPGTTETYQGSGGGDLNIWQIDFLALGLFDPGTMLFALGGVGASDPITFSHASNAALSGTPQDGADDQYRWFSGNALSASLAVGGFINSDGNGWDKSSDINIQVYGSVVRDPNYVPEPVSLVLLGTGLIGAGVMRRRRKVV